MSDNSINLLESVLTINDQNLIPKNIAYLVGQEVINSIGINEDYIYIQTLGKPSCKQNEVLSQIV